MALLLVFAHSVQGREATDLEVEAWSGLLADVDAAEAMEAARAHFRTESRPLWPADIRRATVDKLSGVDAWMADRS